MRVIGVLREDRRAIRCSSRQGGGCGARGGHVVQFGQLAAVVEAVAAFEAVQHGRHPPGEVLRAPHAAQADFGVSIQQVRGAGAIPASDRARENAHVGGGQIEAFGAGGRHDMRGVSGQEKAAILHRFRDEAAHGRHSFLKDRALIQTEIRQRFRSAAATLPKCGHPAIRQIFTGPALQVDAAELRAAHAKQSETALMIGSRSARGTQAGLRRGCRATRKGRLFRNSRSAPAGMEGRQIPWKPSHPPIKSHAISCALAAMLKSDAWRLTLEIVDL